MHLFKVFNLLLGTAPVLRDRCRPADTLYAGWADSTWMSPLQGSQMMLVTEFTPHGSLSLETLSKIDIPDMWWHYHCRVGMWYGR